MFLSTRSSATCVPSTAWPRLIDIVDYTPAKHNRLVDSAILTWTFVYFDPLLIHRGLRLNQSQNPYF